MSFDWLRTEVSEEFARFSPRLDWSDDRPRTRGELEWVLREPARFAFSPEGFEAEARRLQAEADERDARWLAQLELRRERQRSRRQPRQPLTPEQEADLRARKAASKRRWYASLSGEERRAYNRRRTQQLTPEMRERRRAWQRQWYATLTADEKHHLATKHRERYAAADKERLKQQARARYAAADEAAVEARRQALRDYKATHRDYFAAKQREYSARNRERLAAEQRQRYEAKRAAIVGAIRQKSGAVPVAQCTVCGRDFATKEWLTRHAKTKHGQPAQPEASL